MRIGVFGGTFDPPHSGHMAFARAAIEQLQLEEVLWMPANRNPNKKRTDQTSSKHRMAMIRLMIDDQPNMAVSDLEITRGGPSYAIETMEELHFARPGDYWFLLGADALRELPKWKQPEKLMRVCRLAVAMRPPTTLTDIIARLPEDLRGKIDVVTMPPNDASSTEIRSRIERKESTGPMLDKRVLDYIRRNNLYRS